MDENYKQDIHAGVVLHVSQEESQPTESDIKQEAVLYPVYATCPVPASIPATPCSCDCKIQNTKCEHKLSERMHQGGSDTQKAHSVDDCIASEHDRSSDATRYWIVCPGGILKEVKAEPSIDVPDILPVEDVSHNVDQKQLCGSSNHAKMECESQLKVHERNDTGVTPFACVTCGK